MKLNTDKGFSIMFESQQFTKLLLTKRLFYVLMPFADIIYSQKLNRYYIGACSDLERRLYEHNIGHSKFTSTGIPWILKHTESFQTLQEAKKREAAIKKMKSRKYIEQLIG